MAGENFPTGLFNLNLRDEVQMKRNNTEKLNAKVSSYNFLIRLW